VDAVAVAAGAVLLGGLPANWLAWRKSTVWLPMSAHLMVNLFFPLLLIAAALLVDRLDGVPGGAL
jgi:hypothetical protein